MVVCIEVADVVAAPSDVVGVEGGLSAAAPSPDWPVIPILVLLLPRVMFEVGRIPNIPKPGPGIGVDRDRELSPPNALILLANAGLGPGLTRAGVRLVVVVVVVGWVVDVVVELGRSVVDDMDGRIYGGLDK